ncbi:MAG: MraZ family transcriptional regulator [Atopobiaceae bacterium]|nr:MraZ family transcriptional regulator [Atopobiaceae bacterium]
MTKGAEMYLTGAKQFNLDAKGRLTLPADYRREMGEQVCLVPVNDALYGFTPDAHKAWVSSFFPNGFNPRKKDDVKLRRALTSSTVTVEIDSAGRVCVGKVRPEVRERLGLERSVMVVGNDDHFEVWDSARWESVEKDFSEELDSLMFEDE